MATYYVSQDGAGLKTGQSLADAWAISDFNTYSNWSSPAVTAGKISPGDTVYFVGTITGNAITQQSGISGSHIFLRGDYPDHPGVFDGGGARNLGLKIGSDYLTITNLSFKDFVYISGQYKCGLYSDAGRSNIDILHNDFNNTYDSQNIYQCHISFIASSRNLSDINIQHNTFNGPGNACYIRKNTANTYDIYNITFSNNIVGSADAWYPVFGTVYAEGPDAPYSQYVVGGGFWLHSLVSSGTSSDHDITISDNVISNTYNDAIHVGGSEYAYFAGYGPYNVSITGNIINDAGHYPIMITTRSYGDGSLVSNNKINGGGVLKVYKTNGIEVLGGAGLVVEHNEISRIYTATPTGDASAIIMDHGPNGANDVSDGVIIRYNIITDNNYANTESLPAAGIDIYRGTNTQVYFNQITGGGIGVRTTSPYSHSNLVANNIIANNIYGYYEYNFDGGNAGGHQTLYNNIFYQNNTTDIILNFIAGCPDSCSGTIETPVEDFNIFYSDTSEPYIDNRNGSSVEAALGVNSSISDPLFQAGGYHVLSSSPAIGAGIDVCLTTDLDGNAIPGAVGYDIGPYSYMPGWTLFDESMPALTLSPDCPGKLRQVQEWKKVATSREIGRVK